MAEGGSTLASILVRISADATDFLDSLARSTKAARDFAEAGTVIAGGGAAIVGALSAMSEQAATFGSTIYDAQQRTGVATETLAGLKLGAEEVGGSLDNVTAGLRKLATDMQSAADGNKKMTELFSGLGVSVVDSTGHVKDLNTFLPQLSDALGGVSNTTTRAADAQALFGKGGAALLPIFAQGSAGLTDMSQKATELGQSVTDSQAAQSKAFQIAQEDAEKAFSGITMAIGQQFLPALTDLANEVTSHLESVRLWLSEYPQVTDLVMNLGLALAGGGGLLLAVAGVTAGIGMMGTALGAAAGSLTVATGGISTLVAILYTFHDQIWSIEAEIMSGLVGALATAAGAVANLAGAAGLTGLHDRLEDVKFSLENSAMDWKASSDNWAAQSAGVGQVNTQLRTLKPVLDDTTAAHERLTAAQKSFQNGVESIVSSVENNTKKDQELAAAVNQLVNSHVSMDAIVTKLGPDILKYAATHDTLSESMQKAVQAAKDHADAQQHLADVIRQTTEANKEQLAKDVDAINGVQTAYDKLNEDILQANANSGLKTDLPYLNPVQIGDANKNLDEINTTLGGINSTINTNATSSKSWFDGLNISTADFKKSAGAAFDDMFLKGKNVFSDLGNMLQGGALSLGRSIFVDITSHLENDIFNSFKKFFESTLLGPIENLGKSLLSTLTNALGGLFGNGQLGTSIFGGGTNASTGAGTVFGGTAGSSGPGSSSSGIGVTLGTVGAGLGGGLAGSSLGGQIGGIAGGLGGAIGGATLGASAATGLGLAAGSLAAGAVTAGIGTAIGLAIGGITKLVGSLADPTHAHADKFVQEFQNPFAAATQQVLIAERSAMDQGTLTADQADAATQQVQQLWTTMQQNMDNFAAQNAKNAIVVKQAYGTLDPYMQNVLGEMTTRAQGLHDVETQQSAAAVLSTDATWNNTTATTDNTAATQQLTEVTTDQNTVVTTLTDTTNTLTTAAGDAQKGLSSVVDMLNNMFDASTKAATAGAPGKTTTVTGLGINNPGKNAMNAFGASSDIASDSTSVAGVSIWGQKAPGTTDLLGPGTGSLTYGQLQDLSLNSSSGMGGITAAQGAAATTALTAAGLTPATYNTQGVASYAGGVDYVPYDQLAMIHRGERVVPAHENNGSQAPQLTVNVNVAGHVVGVRDLAGELANELYKATRFRGMKLQ